MTTSGTAAPTAAADANAPDGPVRLLARANLPVVVGVVALVTLAAFENRAVSTILPTIVRELDGWALFGASTGATLVTFTIAMAWSGGWTDRVGPPETDAERDMLECAAEEAQPNSRLSCQITVTEALDGLVVRLPVAQY